MTSLPAKNKKFNVADRYIGSECNVWYVYDAFRYLQILLVKSNIVFLSKFDSGMNSMSWQTSITPSILAKVVLTHSVKGNDFFKLLNGRILTIGCPDFAPPNHLTDALVEALGEKDNLMLHQYTRGYV